MAPVFEYGDPRDVNLLASTLNIFENIFNDLASSTPKGDAKTAHLHLQAYSRLASEQLNRLNKANIPIDGKYVYELLNQCNTLVEETGFKATSAGKPYDSLISLGNMAAKLTFSNRFGSTGRAEEADIKSEIPFRQKKEKLIDTLMDNYSHLSTQYPDSALMEDHSMPKKRRPSPPYPVWRMAESILEALMATRKSTSSCNLQHQYDARLRLATHRIPRSSSSYPEFDIFLGLDLTWQEVTVQVVRKSAVKFKDDEKSDCDNRGKKQHQKICGTRLILKRIKVKQLCKPLHDMKIWKSRLLKLEVEGMKLYHLKQILPDSSAFLPFRSQETISFEEFIKNKGSRLTDKTKRIVAVFLGHAVLNLQGTKWMRPSWRSSEVVFYQYLSSIPLRPYIQISLTDSPTDCPTRRVEPPDENTSDSDEDDDDDLGPLHPFPCLVTLAIIVMELYFCQPLEKFAKEYLNDHSIDWIDNDQRYAVALQTFMKYKDQFTEDYAHAIDKCLDANIGRLYGIKLTEQELHDVIYDEIVCRLENELEWVDEHFITNLDNESQRLDLANLGQPLPDGQGTAEQEREGAMLSADTSRVTTPYDSTRVPIMFDKYTKRIRPRNSLNPGSRSTRQRFDYHKPRLFDDKTSEKDISPKVRDDFLDWKQRTLEVYDSFIRGSKPPVKVAILDTGIDLTHPDFATGLANRTRIIKAKNFTAVELHEEDNVHDENGHGTHAAGLMLDFAPDAELYVAKIGRDEPSSPIVVAKAIDFAVTEWKVNIISMSFGWSTQDVSGYQTLDTSIRNALYKTLFFAAASNEGANQLRTFPARQPEVICIHATDANGKPSGFNPPHNLKDDNFATVGEAIESAWPKDLCLEDNDACVAYRTGTSFATPIAAGIAAFLLQYGKENLGEIENDRLATSKGMRAVLRGIKVEKEGYDYICPRLHPDNFFGRSKELIKLDIQDILRKN